MTTVLGVLVLDGLDGFRLVLATCVLSRASTHTTPARYLGDGSDEPRTRTVCTGWMTTVRRLSFPLDVLHT